MSGVLFAIPAQAMQTALPPDSGTYLLLPLVLVAPPRVPGGTLVDASLRAGRLIPSGSAGSSVRTSGLTGGTAHARTARGGTVHPHARATGGRLTTRST